MVVQPRTLLAGIITGVILIIGAITYFIFFKSPSSEVNSVALVNAEAQVVKTSLYDMAVFANLVRAAFDQKMAATEADPDAEPQTVCNEQFKEVDLSLLGQTLNIDIELKIEDVVKDKQVAPNIWPNCADSCTCSTLSTLLDKAIEGGERVTPEDLEATQAAAESLTTADAIRCAKAAENVCHSTLVLKYAEQAQQ